MAYYPPLTPTTGPFVTRAFNPPTTSVTPSPEPEPEPPGSETWSGGQTMAPQLIRGVGVRGTVFSVQFKSDENGTPWTVHRLVNHMRSRRNPSVVRTEK